MSALELKVPPLALWAALAIACGTVSWAAPSSCLPFAGQQVVAAILLFARAGIAIAGVAAFRRAGTTVNPLDPRKSDSMVTGGIYRLSRNPMYLGMAAALLGVAAWHASLPGVALVAAFCAYITRFQIVPEERALRARFGEAFARYQAQVRRWI